MYISSGLVSDFAKNKYDMPRSYSLVLVSFFFFISQVVAANEDSIENLWVASTLLGLAHGSVFSLFPTVCMEWFGMRKNSLRPPFSFLVVI
jgi:predicted MFS family arabinose efflux permease